MNYLYQRMGGGLGFPSEIYNVGFEGEVDARLTFDSEGRWKDIPTDIDAKGLGSRYLRIHVLRHLRRVLAEAIPKSLLNIEKKEFTIRCRFIFVILAPESVEGAELSPRQEMYGNEFLFYRAHLTSPLSWKLGPISGYAIMPAIGINPGWFAERMSKLWQKKAEIDPLENYRDDPDW